MQLHYQLKTLILGDIGAAVFFVFLFRYIHIAFNIGYILKDAGNFRAYGALRPRAGQSSSAGSGATCSSGTVARRLRPGAVATRLRDGLYADMHAVNVNGVRAFRTQGIGVDDRPWRI